MALSLLDIKDELAKLLAKTRGFGQGRVQPVLNRPLPQSFQQPVNFVQQGLDRISQAVKTTPSQFVFPPIKSAVKFATRQPGELGQLDPGSLYGFITSQPKTLEGQKAIAQDVAFQFMGGVQARPGIGANARGKKSSFDINEARSFIGQLIEKTNLKSFARRATGSPNEFAYIENLPQSVAGKYNASLKTVMGSDRIFHLKKRPDLFDEIISLLPKAIKAPDLDVVNSKRQNSFFVVKQGSQKYGVILEMDKIGGYNFLRTVHPVTNKQIQNLLEQAGRTATPPSVPIAGPGSRVGASEKLSDLQTALPESISQNAQELQDFLAGKIKDTVGPKYTQATGGVGASPTARLGHLLNYSDQLLGKGFTKKQVAGIGFEEAKKILGRESPAMGGRDNPLVRKVIQPGAQRTMPGQKIKQTGTQFPSPAGFRQQTGGAPFSRATRQVLSPVTPRKTAPTQTTSLPLQESYPHQSFDDIIRKSGIDVKSKVGVLDMFRTPDRVLNKLGLGQEAKQLRNSYDSYVAELPKQIDVITQWSKRADSPQSSQMIFKHLDGQPVSLSPNDLKIANEIKVYLKDWADRLGLPEDKRIANYITHVFERDFIKKEFDPDLAKIIRERVAGSVYDPFLEQRLGKLGYVEDVWRALDAYVKRATRKASLDPVLKVISDKSKHFEESQFDYVKKYIARVNMQPTKIDNMIDNTIKQVIGYKLGQRPTTFLTRLMRQAGYRGALGLNVGSALRNLTQATNTYAKLGEKYTAVGYFKMLTHGKEELERVGVLQNNFVQDRTLNATKKFWEKTDRVLFSLFETAERINRGSAYFGAKSQALSKGMNEQQAVEYAKKIVRDTQFTFGSVDTPAILQSDINKTFLQFQSFNLKQAEFLAEMVKNKEFAGLTRYILASLAMTYSIGELIGIDPIDAIPFSGLVTGKGTKLGQTPAISAGSSIKNAIFKDKDQYGNPLTPEDRMGNVGNAITPIIPGGVQLKKTFTGLGDVNRGYAQTPAGNVRYPITQSTGNLIRGGLFGPYNLPEAQANRGVAPLSEKQSAVFKLSEDRPGVYQKFIDKRIETKADTATKEELKSSNKSVLEKNNKVYILQDSGDIKTIDPSFQPAPPQLTGLAELDKKAISKYRGEITQKANDIYDLFKAGKLSMDEANSQLLELKKQRDSVAAPKKPKKPAKIRIVAPKPIKTSTRKFKIVAPKIPSPPKIKKPRMIKIKPFKIKKERKITLTKR